MTSETNASTDYASTAIVHRPFGGIGSYRRVSDPAGRTVVHAFPMSELSRVAAAGLLCTPGAYIMTDGKVAYVGESRRPSRRLAEHAADPAKNFARDAYVVGGCDGAAFDKLLTVDLQFRLTQLAGQVGAVSVWKGANPPAPDTTDAEKATHNRIAADALRLLHDAGCRLFHAPSLDAAPPPGERPLSDAAADPTDPEPTDAGTAAVPAGCEEYELQYGGLWARGRWEGGQFVVSAGSEVRSMTNESVDEQTRLRRNDLFAAGVLSKIAGVGDRRRLTDPYPFATASIAAKVLAGAHSAGRWVPRGAGRPGLPA
ncbi:hypothetical protein [Bradyrhizobium guangzhouense]|uniref:GIY-YIG nuclease family protein n=1 Tax=Bradyrhizobium guangzhouense TaxID=1325095 RepID=A0AAE5WVX2_9BRAD|nr:hypothetical protein [Bradyrhizobium guangzhouense]QAU44068.1 hypothetical protein XH91_00985 [Bradyrhizobium guangzhouense]